MRCLKKGIKISFIELIEGNNIRQKVVKTY